MAGIGRCGCLLFLCGAAAAGLNSALRAVRRGVCYATPFPFDWTFNINNVFIFFFLFSLSLSSLLLYNSFFSFHIFFSIWKIGWWYCEPSSWVIRGVNSRKIADGFFVLCLLYFIYMALLFVVTILWNRSRYWKNLVEYRLSTYSIHYYYNNYYEID